MMGFMGVKAGKIHLCSTLQSHNSQSYLRRMHNVPASGGSLHVACVAAKLWSINGRSLFSWRVKYHIETSHIHPTWDIFMGLIHILVKKQTSLPWQSLNRKGHLTPITHCQIKARYTRKTNKAQSLVTVKPRHTLLRRKRVSLPTQIHSIPYLPYCTYWGLTYYQ